MEIDRTTVETDAGEYTIIEYVDTDAGESPLDEHDHEGMELYVYTWGNWGKWDNYYANTGGTPASRALEYFISEYGGDDGADVERRMRLWLRITGTPATFVSDAVNTYSDSYHYFALVDSTWTDPRQAARAVMSEWRAWAIGEVYGYVVEGPDGSHIDSCWGFIGDESRGYMLEQARDSVESDAGERLDTANLVGAGFVGII